MRRILIESDEWRELLQKLKWSKSKSNRDVICTKCWRVYRYMKGRDHKDEHPSHSEFILTTRHYADAEAFMDLATVWGKVENRENGETVVESPYYPG